MRGWCRLFAGCCLVLAPPFAAAALLGTVSFAETYARPLATVPSPPSTAITLRASYSIEVGELEDPDTSIFDTFVLDEAAALQTFTLASAADDPEFTAFITRATNGINDELRIVAIGNQGGGRGSIDIESNFLTRAYASAGPDLVGSTISAVELYIAEIFIDPLATVSRQVNWSISGELRFVGEAPITTPVPLPPTWALLVLALVAGHRRRCRAPE